MRTRRDLIFDALIDRFGDLCDERIGHLAPAADFGEMSGFVTRVFEQLAFALPVDFKNLPEAPSGWVTSDSDCLTALRRLALGEDLPVGVSQPPAGDHFLDQLKLARSDHEQRVQLLTERYACPLNFSAPEEREVREHVLERLMVQDRARIERSSIMTVDSNDLLLKLNLCAIEAVTAGSTAAKPGANSSLTTDLRFLDALNYYYELIPANWRPQAQHHWLLVSYLALYARALTAWSLRYECEQAS